MEAKRSIILNVSATEFAQLCVIMQTAENKASHERLILSSYPAYPINPLVVMYVQLYVRTYVCTLTHLAKITSLLGGFPGNVENH